MRDVEVLDADVSGQTAEVDRGISGNGEVEPTSHGEGVAAPLARNCRDCVRVCPDHHAGVADKRGGGRAESEQCRAWSSSGRYVSDRGLPVGVHGPTGALRGPQSGCQRDRGARDTRDAVGRAIGKGQPARANVPTDRRLGFDRTGPAREIVGGILGVNSRCRTAIVEGWLAVTRAGPANELVARYRLERDLSV